MKCYYDFLKLKPTWRNLYRFLKVWLEVSAFINCQRAYVQFKNTLSVFFFCVILMFTFTKPRFLFFFLDICWIFLWSDSEMYMHIISCLPNVLWKEQKLSIWSTLLWLFPCCKFIYFIAYLKKKYFIHFSIHVRLLFKTPSKSLWRLWIWSSVHICIIVECWSTM